MSNHASDRYSCQYERVILVSILSVVFGLALIFTVLIDTFEAIVLPRSLDRKLRLTSIFRRLTWGVWKKIGTRLRRDRRETWLGAYGPLTLITLIIFWAIFQIIGFALINWGLRTEILNHEQVGLAEYAFFSGGNFFTVGSDYVAATPFGHFLSVTESGLGFGFLAIVISYVPVLAGAFAKRETQITLLDARAGSPPTAVELFRRYKEDDDMEAIADFLKDWEIWSAELLESFVSYPTLAYYRSQHEQQSWLASITTIMDVCALAQLGFTKDQAWAPKLRRQAKLTFAIARHACVDLALILYVPPQPPPIDRLDHDRFLRLRQEFEANGIGLCSFKDAESDLRKVRELYEGYVYALGQEVALEVPEWIEDEVEADNWQKSAYEGHDHFISGA